MKFKTYVSLITLVTIAAIGGLFVLKKPDGTPWITIGDMAGSPASKITKVYRWKENGSWSFAGQMPEGVPPELVEMIEINPDTNLIQGLRPEKGLQITSSQDQQDGSDTPDRGSYMSIPVPLTVQPDQLNKLFEDAKNIQNVMNERTNVLNTQTNY